ncbi:hypothetical protein Q4506_05960 [Colwellia sp. 4_MG-2023]|uniref:hypothetical protein n=1 Tax=unclassified Colwellia TaxID=196834 RepID=UPI001C099F11|nr:MULTISPECIES: hypothetical protein [unclassified Colwellia]MBU2925432.1 hypothetical protein [Colwellia sp. C2M11]MDO6506390.1 hypothetical protein [Colwellia sp. 5_MG-2023]MDO6555214.1 hypothetical protein [Colwellia sp. 4_MG-2023]MDO6651600.1 hypothetical protein [Colwellia sp. 3_MG-2023]MDO6665002.1 hypothetical protein [Colwellia sp. 2_MG-2023]
MIKKSFYAFVGLSAVVVLAVIISESYELYSSKVVTLDSRIKEVSGIEFDKAGNLWAINDGGNSAQIHQVQSDGKIKKSVTITNGRNLDWEDMTQDDFGHFFIGDFGNNDNMRKWLTIYKIENPIDIKGTETEAEIIKFTFPEHRNFPPKASEKNFDLEAFVFYKRHLYLFSKNRTKPFDGDTNLYKIGDHADNYQASFISNFNTCTTHQKLCWITSAALSPDRSKLVLLDSERLWLFENWQGDDFFSGDAYKIDLGIVTQKEAVTFSDENTIIFTDEEFYGVGRNSYMIKLDQVTKERIQTKAPSKQ